MSVKRIVVNIGTSAPDTVQAFYSALFDLDVAMDLGWIKTLTSGETATVQMSIAKEGGSGTPVPDMSIEVDAVDAVYARARTMGCQILYGPVDEPWGVRRFYLRDPAGKLLNVLSHLPTADQ